MDDFDVDHGLDRAEVAHVEPHGRCPLSQNAALNGSSPACVAPSASTIDPVIRLATSEARNITTAAISSGSPSRAIGVPSIQAPEHRLIVLGISGKRSVDIGRRHGVNAQAMSR
jgi:hypothetical protein